MMFRKMQSTIGAVAACALTMTGAVHANDPVLSGSYGWEDGQATIFGSSGSLVDPTNVTHPEPVNSGDHALRFTREVGVPEARIAYIENLQDGDRIVASVYLFDDGDTTGRSRIWANYADSGDPNSFRGSAGGPNIFTAGIGWQQMTYEWIFDSNPSHPSGPRDALTVHIRGYSQSGPSSDPATGPTDHYVDDIVVHVYCAANNELKISFPDGSFFDEPDAPGPECNPDPCDHTTAGSYGWEDEVATAFGFTGNITILENTGPVNGVSPNSGDRMLRARQGSSSGTPQVWVAFIENLVDGDEINVWMHAYDDQPPTTPRMRMWGHRAVSGNPNSVVSQFGGLWGTYTTGIGWEQLHERWIFDSDNGSADALMVQMRLYTGVDDTDFFMDDIYIEICSNNPNITVTFPEDAPGPADPCDLPSSTPTLQADFGWEDGESTILGLDDDDNGNITAANVDELVNSGDRALRVTEAPHIGGHTPRVFVAYIEHLQDGDVIHGRFHAFDDTPGSNPRVRIFGRRAYSGNINSGGWSAGGNNEPTSGIGWEEICHTWVYDSGSENTDALVIEARVYSTPSDCEECSTDFYIDDMEIFLWANANATITLPDGSVIGEPPLICPADIDNSGSVGIFDLFTVLGAWGTSDPQADINNDGLVDGADVGILLASWGPCAVPYLAPMEGSVDLVVETTALRSGMNRHDIFAQLHDPDDALVNVFDANVNFSGSFDSSSYFAIGQQHASVTPDPNLDTFEFDFGIGMGVNAGWYNENPPNEIGRAGLYGGNRVLILSLTMDAAENAAGTLSVTYEDPEGRPIYATAAFDTADVSTPCPGDLNGDGVVDVSDLLSLLSAWGPCPGCDADINGDGVVDVSDLLMLLSAWGSCPR